MIRGKGRFRASGEVEGSLEVSAGASALDTRLQAWLQESSVVLPRLQSIVKRGERRLDVQVVLDALEDFGRRLEKLEAEVERLADDRPR
jgi:hypothetical protein